MKRSLFFLGFMAMAQAEAAERRLLLTGELRAVESTPMVTPRTDAWMLAIQWMAEDGSWIKAGEPVVQFDSAQVESQWKERQASILQAEAELEQAMQEAEATHQQNELEVVRSRIARDKAKLDAEVPQKLQAQRSHQENQLALSRAESALKKAQEKLKASSKSSAANLKVLKLNLEKSRQEATQAKSVLDKMVLRAPVDGVVVHALHPWEGRKWRIGDSSWAGIILVEVPNLTKMEVEAQLFDVDDGRVMPGQKVRCTLDSFPEVSFVGQVSKISGVAQALDRVSSRRTFTVWIDLEESGPKILKPGMSVKVEIVS